MQDAYSDIYTRKPKNSENSAFPLNSRTKTNKVNDLISLVVSFFVWILMSTLFTNSNVFFFVHATELYDNFGVLEDHK